MLFISDFGNSCGFLKNITSFIALCTDNFSNSSLSDNRISVTSKTCIHKKLIYIFKPYLLSVNKIFTFAASV